MTANSSTAKRVAILGGGIAALSAAYEITNTPGHEVTIHTLGWRLGGKCASSRGPDGRIQEHGIHGFLGSYFNAMPMMAAVYAELDRPRTDPLATFDQAFMGIDTVQLYAWDGATPDRYEFTFPVNTLFPDPGNPGALLDVEQLVERVIALLENLTVQHDAHPERNNGFGAIRPVIENALAAFARSVPVRGVASAAAITSASWQEARSALRMQRGSDPHTTQIITIIDWIFTLIEGSLADDLVTKGFDGLDGENWTDWLARHGALAETITSPMALNTVNLAYQYPKGDTSKPSAMAAGCYVHWSLRALAFCGHAVYAFAAGTGETIIAPIYALLIKRGVKFEFFSKVENLTLNTQGTAVESVAITRQASLKHGNTRYEPLCDVKGLPSWPDAPFYDQLEQGDALKAGGYDLESWWTPWDAKLPAKTLSAGQDFDVLVFALSLGAVPFVASDLVARSDAWRAMVEALPCVQTQSLQIWLSQSYTELGWEPVFGLHGTPLTDTWMRPLGGQCELRHLIRHEDWPADATPKSLWYFCDALAEDGTAPPFTDHDYPARMQAKVRETAIEYLNTAIAGLMPLATNGARGGIGPTDALDFSLLVDTRAEPGRGTERIDSQFIRANIDPTERYVTSPPRSTEFRLRPWQTGFANLIIAGDWTYTGLNVGSVECTVMSGRLASHAITGFPALADIPGYPIN